MKFYVSIQIPNIPIFLFVVLTYQLKEVANPHQIFFVAVITHQLHENEWKLQQLSPVSMKIALWNATQCWCRTFYLKWVLRVRPGRTQYLTVVTTSTGLLQLVWVVLGRERTRDISNAQAAFSHSNFQVTAHVCRSAKLYQEADGMLRGVLPRVTKREDKLAILAQLLIVALKAKLVEPKADVGWSSTTSDMLTSVPAGATPCVSQVLEGLCRFAENNLR